MACGQAQKTVILGSHWHEAAASKILLKEYFKRRTEKGREMESQRAFCSGSHGRGSEGSADTVVRKWDSLNVELGNITVWCLLLFSISNWMALSTNRKKGLGDRAISSVYRPLCFKALWPLGWRQLTVQWVKKNLIETIEESGMRWSNNWGGSCHITHKFIRTFSGSETMLYS